MNESTQAWLPTITPRWREVEEYAMKRKITIGEAVTELINRGLSYSDETHLIYERYTPEADDSATTED